MPDVDSIARRRFDTGIDVRTTPGPGSDPSASPRSEPPSRPVAPPRAVRRRLEDREHPVRAVTEPLDCTECGAAGSVYGHFCEVCYADVPPGALKPVLHPSIPLRFSDVMAELRAIAELASGVGDVPGERVAAACRRAESLLTLLRRQFLSDVVFADGAPGDRAPA